jgi:hypothetical protein
MAEEQRENGDPWEALTSWFERFIGYIATKQALAAELTNYLDRDAQLFKSSRAALWAAGEPLLTRAQEAGVVRPDAEIGDVMHMVMGSPRCRRPIRARRRTSSAWPSTGLRYRPPDRASAVRAGVGRPVACGAAVPVEAHRGRVVVEHAAARFEDGLGEVLHGLARMHLRAARDHALDVDAGGVALQHAVGEEQEAVAGLERQDLLAVLVARHGSERRLGLELHAVDAAVAQPERQRMARR